jgi:hypothetical protein
MTIRRMGVVVADRAAATAFFVELGLKASVESGVVDRIVRLEGTALLGRTGVHLARRGRAEVGGED